MSDRDQVKKDSKAARGATLFNKNRVDKKASKKRKEVDISELGQQFSNKTKDPHYESLVIKYLVDSGIEVGSYKNRYILRRLRVRMGRLKINSYKAYLDYIKKNLHELKEIQESLSINVTRFFRNRDTFEKIKRDILPSLFRKKKAIKIWSAGCAVGAEPYSLAMICSDIIPSKNKITILATDVKEELLRIARYGVYAEPYLDEMTESEKTRYFTKIEIDEYKVKPHIKSMVSFQKHDLMKDEYTRNIDLIVCRNVLIYIDREAQNKLLNKFFDVLNPSGILVLGRTETLFGDWRKLVEIVSTKHRIYTKKTGIGFQEIPYTQQKMTPSSIVNIKSKKTSSQTKRMEELRNFRKTFEQRKQIWERRLEESKKKREAQRIIRNHSRDNKKNVTRSRLTIDKTHRISKTPTKLEIDKAKISGSLSNYRSLLKKVDKPIRASKIRKDINN